MALNGYAPIPRQTLGVTIAAASGGNLTGSGTIYLWVQLRNRTGFNTLGDGAGNTAGNAIAYTSGQKITVTVASTVVSGGEDPFELVVSAAATDTPANARRIASLWLRDSATVDTVVYSGQGSFISFPETLELTEDEHIEYTSQTVANAAALPTGNDLINGMVRLRSDDSTYYRYDSQQTAWTEYPTGFNSNVASLTQAAIAATQPQGCERQLSSITAGIQTDVLIQPPNYNPDGSQQPAGLIYAIANGYESDSGAAVLQSSEIAFRFFINGVNNSTLFSGQVVATLKGYHNMSDRTLDTTPTGVGSAVTLGSNESTSGVAGLSLPEDLERGYVALYELQLQVDSTVLASKIRNGDVVTAYPVVEGLLGIPFAPALALGELVLPTSDNMLVVPSSTAKVKMLGGVATVVDSSTDSGYLTRDRGVQNPVGLSNSTADQRICFNGPFGGDIVVRATVGAVQAWEVTRAIISTETGTYTASSYTSATAIAGNGETLQLSVPIPTAIRSDYPDTQLAGNTQGDFTVPTIVPFVLLSGTIYQLADVAVSATAGNTQTINITDLSGATTVGSLPDSSSDTSFGLWGYGANSSAAISSASSLAAGSYQCAIAWKYTGTTVSKISHSTSDGAIAVAGISYADLVEARGKSGFATTTASYTQPAANANVTISVDFSGWMSLEQTIFVQGGGYYTVASVPSDTSVQITNLGCGVNAAEGATVATDARVSPAGATGNSAYGLFFDFDTGTSSGAGSGELRLNNATPASATQFFVSEADGQGISTTAFLDSLTSASKLVVRDQTDFSIEHKYAVSGAVVDNGSDRTIPVTYESGSGSFSDGNCIFLSTSLAGAAGLDSGLAYTFDSTTTVGASGGEIRFNNATIGSVTSIFVNATDRNSVDLESFWTGAVSDNSVLVVQAEVGNAIAIFTITATSGTSEQTLTVTHLSSNGSFNDGDQVRLSFQLKGATGATGSTGSTGATGANGQAFGTMHQFSTTTSTPPSTGEVRFDNASVASVSNIHIHDTDRDSTDVGAVLNVATVGSIASVVASGDASEVAYFTVDSVTDNTSYVTYGVTYLSGAPTFTNAQDVTFQVALKGSTGSAGAAGADAGLSYTFDTGTSVGAASGELRLDNGTVASATNIYVNATDADSNDLQTFWTNAVSIGSAIVIDNTTTGAIAIFTIDSRSGTTEQTLGVTHLASNGTFNDSDSLQLSFQLKGDTGATGASGANGSDGADGADGEVTYGAISTNAQSGTTYTLVLSDQGKVVECSNASAITLTVPPNSSVAYATGTQILLLQTGAGQVTVAAGAGVTINSSNGLKLRAQWSMATLLKRATNTWVISGDTEV